MGQPMTAFQESILDTIINTWQVDESILRELINELWLQDKELFDGYTTDIAVEVYERYLVREGKL